MAGAVQVSSQPAARRTQDKDLTSSSFVESVASKSGRFAAEDDDGITSVNREKHAQEREEGVRTLRGKHVVTQPVTILGERLVGHNAKLICQQGSRGVGVRVGGGHGNVLVQRLMRRGGSSRKHQRTQGESGTADNAKLGCK